MKITRVIKTLVILMIADVFLLSGIGFNIFCTHSRFYSQPVHFVIIGASVLLWFKLQVFLMVWASKEAVE